MTQRVLRLPQNQRGRDFVVGDIHFKTIDLHKGLQALGFDSAIDRVIAVGDLIDRGPGVLDGLKLLEEPWFFTVRGNHEQMLIRAYREDPDARYSAHGAGWWLTIADESRPMIIEKLDSLPAAIEIESARGTVGVVHADVPAGMTWADFVGDIANPQIEEVAFWGRERIKKHCREGVAGIWRVCTGHTWTPEPLRLGNVIGLDRTGGGEGPLAFYCVQDDTVYIEGRSVSLDHMAVVTELLGKLERTMHKLKATTQAENLTEARRLSQDGQALARRANTAWLTLQPETHAAQQLLHGLHDLSLAAGEHRAAKLDQLKSHHAGTQIEGLLTRLFG